MNTYAAISRDDEQRVSRGVEGAREEGSDIEHFLRGVGVNISKTVVA